MDLLTGPHQHYDDLMKQPIRILTSLAAVLCAAIPVLPQDRKDKNIQTILEVFRLIEERDPQKPNFQRQRDLVDSNVEFYWPASLPYGGSDRGIIPTRDRPTWGSTWTPLQPTKAERKMDPRVVAANDNEVVVLYHQRGLSSTGERYDGEVLGLYGFREGKLARGQMFYFDEAGAAQFLAKAKSRATALK